MSLSPLGRSVRNIHYSTPINDRLSGYEFSQKTARAARRPRHRLSNIQMFGIMFPMRLHTRRVRVSGPSDATWTLENVFGGFQG